MNPGLNLKGIILFILIACYAKQSVCQNRKIDSLKVDIRKQNNDSLKWLSTMRLSVAYVPFDLDSSFHFCRKALSIAERTQSNYMLYYSYNEMGNCYSDILQKVKAIEYYEKSYNIANVHHELDRNFPLGNIATLKMDQDKYEEAKDIIKKIISDYVKEEGVDSLKLSTQYLNLGVCQFFTNELSEAEISYAKSLNLNNHSDEYTYLETVNNLGAVYRKLGKYNKAIEILTKNEKPSKLLGSDEIENQRLLGLALVYYNSSNFKEAEKYFLKADEMKKGATLQNRQDINLYLSKIYEKENKHREALAYYKKFQFITDSLAKKTFDDKIISYDSRIKIVEQEKEIASQNLKLLNSQEQSRKWQYLLLSLFLIGASLAIWYYYRQKLAQQKMNTILLNQKLETEKAREMEELKTAFFTNISHEFRTPITLIKGPLQELAINSKADQKPFINLISKQVDRLYMLINQLLDLTKVDTGNMPISQDTVNVYDFFEDIKKDFDGLAKSKDIIFSGMFPSSAIFAQFDAEKVKKITTNLLSNAFKFTNGGGRIDINTKIENGKLKINIDDDGIGIAAHKLDKIFDRFVSINNKHNVEGTGIGLALSKELAQLLGGSIKVESEEQKGSRFIVTFPVNVIGGIESGSSNTSFQANEEVDTEILKPSILIIEDNEDMQFFLREILQKDWKVYQAYHGKEGYEKAIENLPDIILSDIMMPQEDGITTLQKLKKNAFTSHIPVIMLTAKSEHKDKIIGLKEGAVDYLTKPFDSNELTLKLANIISLRRERQEQVNKKLYSIEATAITEVSDDEKFIEKIKEVVEEKYSDEGFSIEELGSKMGMSRSQLYRKVNALTGESPIEILKNYRLTKAKDLLTQKVGNVSEVAFRCGFSSPSYFIKCFKEKYGYTPSKSEINENM